MGRWVHPTTGNQLTCGLNLNYLSDEEIEEVRKYLNYIMKPASLKNKYWVGRSLLPAIWRKAWRTYDERYIRSVDQAEFEPADVDYQQDAEKQVAPPQQQKPTQDPGDQEVAVSPKQQEIEKLKDVQDKAAGEAPKSWKDRIARFSKDTISRLATFFKNKLGWNKKRSQATQQVDKLKDVEDERDGEIEREIQDINDASDEIENNEFDDVEESKLTNLDLILETVVKPKNLVWKSAAQYKYWHDPLRIVEHQNKLKGPILNYCNGDKLCMVYHPVEDCMVVDFVDHISEVLAKAKWGWDETVRLVLDEDIQIECPDNIICEDSADIFDHPDIAAILELLNSSDL